MIMKVNLIGEFEFVGEHNRKTLIRFRKNKDYEASINLIDMDYDSEDSIFTGSIYKIEATLFIEIINSKDGKGLDLKHEVVEYKLKYSYI